MGRKVESIHQFVKDPRFGLVKQKTVVRCDDGHVYEFEEAEDAHAPRLVRGFKPSGEMTHLTGSKVLPGAVEESVDSLFTEWRK